MEKELLLAVVRLFIFLPLILALAYITVRFGLGRISGINRAGRQLEIIEQIPINSKTGIAVVRCGERYFLIGVGEKSPELLTELPDYPAVSTSSSEVKLYSLVEQEKELSAANGTARVNLLNLLQNTWRKIRGYSD